MEQFLILVGLALAVSVILEVIDELIPFKPHAALAPVIAVAVATGFAWTLGYSVFTAFGQELRTEWMHPLATGLVLVATSQFLRSVVAAIGRSGDQAARTTETGRVV